MVRHPVRLLSVLLAFPVAAAAQPPEPVPGCLQERIATVAANAVAIDADGDRVPFISQDDPLGTNPGHLEQVFLWREGLDFDRLKGTNRSRQLSTDAAGRRIAFVSDAPITPGNAQGELQVFLWDEAGGTRQITDHEDDLEEVFDSSIDASGTRIAFVRWVYDAPVSNPVRFDLVVWEEGVGERVVFSTEDARLDAPAISGDGRRVAFLETPALLTVPIRLRLWDETTGNVTTLLEAGGSEFPNVSEPAIDGDGDRIAFSGGIDPLGANPDGGSEVFLWDEADGLRQLTDSATGGSFRPSISDDGRAIAFIATTEQGSPDDPVQQAFLWREGTDGSSTLTQVTAWPPGPNVAFPGAGAAAVAISRDGRRIAHSRLHPGVGGDPATAIEEVWVFDCGAPAPPFDEWLRSPDVPGFEVQVRIGGEREGAPEPLCIPETLCVSGALPGRSEVFVRIEGPKPNGRLWPTLVKFTTSEVEVWIRQLATGEVEHYRLRGASPGFDELPGLFDREGFPPV